MQCKLLLEAGFDFVFHRQNSVAAGEKKDIPEHNLFSFGRNDTMLLIILVASISIFEGSCITI